MVLSALPPPPAPPPPPLPPGGFCRTSVAGIARVIWLISFKFVFVFTKRVAFVDRFKQRACPRFCILIERQIIHELVFIERLEDNTEDSLVAGGFQPRRVLRLGSEVTELPPASFLTSPACGQRN